MAENIQIEDIDVRDSIANKLKEIERPLTWLADKTSIPYNTLHSCITRKLFKVSADNLHKINEVLGTSFI